MVDLQGSISTGIVLMGKCMELIDPAIHCVDLTRFGRTNLGTQGMGSFFSRVHEICHRMGLTVGGRIGAARRASDWWWDVAVDYEHVGEEEENEG